MLGKLQLDILLSGPSPASVPLLQTVPCGAARGHRLFMLRHLTGSADAEAGLWHFHPERI